MKILGLAGGRRTGKDTFAQILRKTAHPQIVIVHAFAKALKDDLKDLFQEKFGADIYTMEGEQKELLRPILISYGTVWREIDPLHWVKEVEKSIDVWHSMEKPDSEMIHVITDFRFSNEYEHMKKKYGPDFSLLFLERLDCIEPTPEEKQTLPELKKRADWVLTLKTDPDLSGMKEQVRYFYHNYILGHSDFP
jgi:hypothetical protein